MNDLDLKERLRAGVREVGLADDNNTELFDIEAANELMHEAADRIAALEDALRERDAVLSEIVRANNEAPDYGMCDARDNDGEWYQSAHLATWLDQAAKLLAKGDA